MSDIALTPPLAHRTALKAPGAAIVDISPVSDRAMIDLRVAPDDTAARKALEKSLGISLPSTPRTSVTAGGVTALWLSIDQWLIVMAQSERETRCTALEKIAARRFVMATDLSDARAIIRLEGPGALEVVMKGASADLTLAPHGMVRRMTFAGIAAFVHVVGTSPPVLDLYVSRSFADYAWTWLAHAARPGAELRFFGTQTPPET